MRLIALFLVFLLTSCTSDPEKEKKKETLPEKPADSLKTAGEKEVPLITFSPLPFRDSLTAFVSSIHSLKHPFEYTTDGDSSLSDYVDKFLSPQNRTSIKKYFFDSGDYFMSVTIYEADYADSSSAATSFVLLREHFRMLNKGKTTLCGTKANDFYYRSGKRLFWLNAGCPYDVSRFKKIDRLFKQSVSNLRVSDSLKCACGFANITLR